MESNIPQIATILRSVTNEVFSGKGKLCLSASYLNKLNNAIETHIREDMKTFHMVQTSNAKTNLIRDLQFLLDVIEKTICLKLNPDIVNDYNIIDIRKFKNIKTLEIHKLHIDSVVGLQKLRSQLQELLCSHSLNCVSDVLDKCGGDNSQRYNWSELKRAIFSYNDILELDDSFECTLSLHTLDLSHNKLSKASFINQLPNLKYLNLSFNRLDNVPLFKGQIRNRLQVLLLNNNFIEDLTNLSCLTNIVQLDLSQNCLLDHKSLLSISHLISLQWLNLQGNPMSFHPHHRNIASNYLNKNASSLKFVLDGVALNKSEKTLVGSLYPVLPTQQVLNSSSNSLDSLSCSMVEKPRKVRNVMIEDDILAKPIVPVSTPTMSLQHMELKKQVEQLRNQYGESWLYRDSGLMVQDALGFEKSTVLSSTPFESALESLYISNGQSTDNTHYETAKEIADNSSTLETDIKTVAEEPSIYNVAQEFDEAISDESDGEEILTGGEECIFLVQSVEAETEVFVVLTESHISERDVTTSKEKGRWHINTVVSCTKLEVEPNKIKLEFDTLRRDRKQRIYEFENDECEGFYKSLLEKLNTCTVEEQKVNYQCMKCSEIFSIKTTNTLLEETPVNCPKCASNLVVETT